MFITISETTLILEAGKVAIFPNQTYEDYERFLQIRQSKKFPKLSFNAVTKEIRVMSPLPSHGNRVDTLSDLVKIILNQKGQDWDCFDPITLKLPPQAGVEPDKCFYIDNRQAILGKDRINLQFDPPPDLAIEVDFTSITDIQAYQCLKIPELWIYRQEALKIYLWENGEYRESDQSRLFTDIDIKGLLPYYVELGWTQGSSVAVRQFSSRLG